MWRCRLATIRQNLLEDELACESNAVDISLVWDLISAVATCADSGSDTEDEEEAAMELDSPKPSAGPLCRGVCGLQLFVADLSHCMSSGAWHAAGVTAQAGLALLDAAQAGSPMLHSGQ